MDASLTVDAVLSAFSHEARTPLAALRGALALLTEGTAGALDDDARGLVDLAVRNIRRLESLLTSVLDSGRVARGEWPVDPIPARLDRIARSAVDEAVDGLARVPARVELVVPGDLPLVPADPEGMRRVLKNLVANAVRFTPHAGVVTVDAWVDGGDVVLQVSDTGPGVPEEDREWIFGRFRQGRSDNGKKGGMGLGLYLSHQIVRAHGGTLTCEPPPDGTRGACFQVRLPITPASPTLPDTRSMVPLVRVRRADGAPLSAGQVFRVSEAMRTVVPSARRWEGPDEVTAMLPLAPMAELESAVAGVQVRLSAEFDAQLVIRQAPKTELVMKGVA